MSSTPTGEQRRRRWPWIAGGAVVLAAAGVYGTGYAMAGDSLPRGTTVDGVSIGGVDSATATTTLREAMQQRATAPITLAAGGKSVKLDPAQAGLSVDYQATVEQAGAGKSLDPVHIWNVLRGGGPIEPVVRTDQKALQAAVAKAAPSFAAKVTDATVALQREKVTLKPGVNGAELDQAKAVDAVSKAYLDTTSVEAPVKTTEPAVTTEEAKQFVASQITPRVSSPLVLDLGAKGKVPLTGPGIGELTKITSKDGQLSATTDMDVLYKAATTKAAKAGLTAPKDARWALQGGKPTLVPGKPGEQIDRKSFDKLVAPALVKTGAARTVKVAVAKKEPEHTTEEAKKAAVKQVTGEFTTYFPHADYRNTNLSVAASRVNNAYIAPGETFSMNDTIGPRTPGSGFVDGWVISGDHLVKENAGGISQSGTTVFNALFFSGLQHVEHQPHTMYFDRYPAGREATLYYGSIDVKFKNDSPYGAILQASVNPSSPGNKGSITVKVWSTKVYTAVKSSELAKSNFTSGRTLHRSGEKCHAQAASPGFTVNYSRLFYKGSQVVKREPYTWTYAPTDEIICD
ncbi:VanW family protein [Luteococcus peritonei]|uniref:VanW family protein n=1 Tax=Luteococcus peritonei TaxID=88874 RepID=A0ABW4RV27_9ACTN